MGMGAPPAGLGTAPACPEHQWGAVLSRAEAGDKVRAAQHCHSCHRVRAVHAPVNNTLCQM